MVLSGLPVSIGSGTTFDVEDTSQDLSVKIMVRHAVLSEEETPSGFSIASNDAAAAKGGEGTDAAPIPSATERGRSEVEDAGAGAKRARPAVVDGIVCLD